MRDIFCFDAFVRHGKVGRVAFGPPCSFLPLTHRTRRAPSPRWMPQQFQRRRRAPAQPPPQQIVQRMARRAYIGSLSQPALDPIAPCGDRLVDAKAQPRIIRLQPRYLARPALIALRHLIQPPHLRPALDERGSEIVSRFGRNRKRKADPRNQRHER